MRNASALPFVLAVALAVLVMPVASLHAEDGPHDNLGAMKTRGTLLLDTPPSHRLGSGFWAAAPKT